MVAERKLVRHDIQKNNQLIPVYTLGVNGAAAAGIPSYEHNYWIKYEVEDVLKSLLFFSCTNIFWGREFPLQQSHLSALFSIRTGRFIFMCLGEIFRT